MGNPLYQLIIECEQWRDSVSTSNSETQQAWRLGFAAAMQRADIYGTPIVANALSDARQEAAAKVLAQVQALITDLAEEQSPQSREETALYVLSQRITEQI